jgi:iron(II)-dependent oxidoreductase
VFVTPNGTAPQALRQAIAEALAVERARTLELIAPLDEAQLTAQHSPLQSPIVWDLGHVANYEAQWAICAVDGGDAAAALDPVYDPVRNPRRVRGELRLPDLDNARAYLAAVRERTQRRLERVSLDSRSPLLADAYVYAMIAQHEAQHSETILQTIQLIPNLTYEPRWREEPPAAARAPAGGMARVAAGPFVMGTDDRRVAYDNERPARDVDLPAYQLDVAPVTNAEYLAFMSDGGYRRRELWCAEGRAWLERTHARHPGQWIATGGGGPRYERCEGDECDGWHERAFGRIAPLAPDRPVVHVCWYEASAYARWAGKRLPTEAEWEKAAAWDPRVQRVRRYPWGDAPPDGSRANLDQRRFAPAPAGAYPEGRSAAGCQQMIGDVWEWTASDFEPYPGFQAFPYEEYSAVHFGRGYKVLRGGSWATRAVAIRATFRNWDLPERRQIFAGFRCAADA